MNAFGAAIVSSKNSLEIYFMLFFNRTPIICPKVDCNLNVSQKKSFLKSGDLNALQPNTFEHSLFTYL